MKIRIVVTTYNNEHWTPNLIKSIATQDYDNWTCLVIDDCSTDGTGRFYDQWAEQDSRVKVIHNPENYGKSTNLAELNLPATYDDISYDDVILFIDGDDWLFDEFALEYIAEVYSDSEVMVAYGKYVDYPSMTLPAGTQNTPYSHEVHEFNAYCMDHWRASHPKTMRFSIWSNIASHEFDGITFGDDLVMMFRAMEQVQEHQIVAMDEILYVYNDSAEHIPVNPNIEKGIRERAPYYPINVAPTQITCKLAGGLGNMMFQIAFVYAYAKDFPHCTPVFVRDHTLPNQGRNYANYLDSVFKNLNWVDSYNDLNDPIVVPESVMLHGQIEPDLRPMKFSGMHDYVFDGHFQNWRLFQNIEEELPDIFNWPSKQPFFKNRVGIHVRRGDYVKFPNHHPMLPIEYYKDILSRLPEDVSGIDIYTDSPEWCKKHFPEVNIIIGSDHKITDWHEMQLMSRYNYLIISNSSFSWWAAYLASGDTEVYAPKTWFGPAVTENYDMHHPFFNLV